MTSKRDSERQILDQLEKLDSKVDKLDDRLGSMDKTLVRQEENLRQHMYRTELLEESLKSLKADVKPAQHFVVKAEGILKFVGIV